MTLDTILLGTGSVALAIYFLKSLVERVIKNDREHYIHANDEKLARVIGDYENQFRIKDLEIRQLRGAK